MNEPLDDMHFAIKSLQSLQATFDAIPDMLLELDLDGCIFHYHPACFNSVAIPQHQLTGKTLTEVFTPEVVDAFMGALQQANATGLSSGTQYALGQYWFELSVSRKTMPAGHAARFVMLSRDITQRKLAHQKLSDLSVHFQNVREEEKARIAREIHDDLGGTLTALKMDICWLAEELASQQIAAPYLKQIDSMAQLIDGAINVTRSVITGLRPTILDDLGLLATIEWQAAQFQQRTGITCKVNCIEDVENVQSKCQQEQRRLIALFRIFQEALTNIARHSHASNVAVEFQHSDDEIMLLISDNGCGLPAEFNLSSNAYGLLGMHERVRQLCGRISFDRSISGGLAVLVTLPVIADNRKMERI